MPPRAPVITATCPVKRAPFVPSAMFVLPSPSSKISPADPRALHREGQATFSFFLKRCRSIRKPGDAASSKNA